MTTYDVQLSYIMLL